MLRQTAAMLVDAYRELNSKKLFWISIILSSIAIIAFAALGISEDGITFLSFTIPLPGGGQAIPKDLFYKSIFASLGVRFWLPFVVTSLALVSTAGIIPSFISDGSIELYLSKPISRTRIYLTKFVSGMLFVGLQIGIFSFAAFAIIGIRGGDWEPRILLAIPIVLLFFSYLFAFCTFIGLITKSTITALLLTVLLWLLIMLLSFTDMIFVTMRVQSEMLNERWVRQVEIDEQHARDTIARMTNEGEPIPDEESWPEDATDELEAVYPTLIDTREHAEKSEKVRVSMTKWHRIILASKLILPKTGETLDLLKKVLFTEEDYARMNSNDDDTEVPNMFNQDVTINQSEYTKRVNAYMLDRSLPWVLGTSLAFELFFLGLGTIIFVRRDF